MVNIARRAGIIAAGGVVAAAVGTTVLAAALARALVTPARRRDDVRILELNDRGVVLERTPDTSLPGRYALWVGKRIAATGRIVEEDEHSVTRALSGKARKRLADRSTARFSGYHLFSPKHLDLPWRKISVETELGPAPAWIVGDEDAAVWCVQVHGRGVSRHETIRAVTTFAEAGMASIVVSYRNDREAPWSADGLYRLGLDEWRDADSAIDVAVERGAQKFVVMGWSMGGAITMQLARRSRHRRRIVGIVLDSPVVAWGPTLRLHTQAARLPVAIMHAAISLLSSPAARLTGGQSLDIGELDSIAFAESYTVPILLMHSVDDGYVPPDASRAFAKARPDIVTYDEWQVARHTKLWNYDEKRYDRTIRTWLERNGLAD